MICGLDTTRATPWFCSAWMRAMKLLRPPSTSDMKPPSPKGVMSCTGMPLTRRPSLPVPLPNRNEARSSFRRQLTPSLRSLSVLRSMMVDSISSACGSTSSDLISSS